jgi:uncharacterized protein involved in exopolysaccharide biosynthesis
VLQTLAPNDSFRSAEPAFQDGERQSYNVGHYIDVFKRRIFYFLVPFGLFSVLGLYGAATVAPSYLSEGKILVETQRIASDLVRPVVTATPIERIQLIRQRILTRDSLLSIAAKFGLFSELPGIKQSQILDLMRLNTRVQLGDVDGQPRLGDTSAVAFTIGFVYSNPEIAMRVANEFVTLLIDEDTRSRTSRSTEAVKVLTGETKNLENQLEANQTQLLEVARRPRDSIPETSEREKSQLTALAALKAELIQKMSIYSEAHPAVTALKKRIAAMEKSLTESPRISTGNQTADDVETLKRQREILEKRLADANAKLASARLSERLDLDQQSDRLQVIEAPQLPQLPLKSTKVKIAGSGLALALALGLGAVMARDMLDGSIRNRDQLSGLVNSDLVVLIPYMTTGSDLVRARIRKAFIVLTVGLILIAWSGLAAAILFHLPVELLRFDSIWTISSTVRQ